MTPPFVFFFFFFNDTATTEIYTLSLHDALPISLELGMGQQRGLERDVGADAPDHEGRSEEHTSELQSPCNLVCRLLLEKKKKIELPRAAVSVIGSEGHGYATTSATGATWTPCIS